MRTDLADLPDDLAMEQSLLLDELDRRQDSVLNRLNELNASIEALLKECLVARDEACQAVGADPAVAADPTHASALAH